MQVVGIELLTEHVLRATEVVVVGATSVEVEVVVEEVVVEEVVVEEVVVEEAVVVGSGVGVEEEVVTVIDTAHGSVTMRAA